MSLAFVSLFEPLDRSFFVPTAVAVTRRAQPPVKAGRRGLRAARCSAYRPRLDGRRARREACGIGTKHRPEQGLPCATAVARVPR